MAQLRAPACLLATHRALLVLDCTWETTSPTGDPNIQPAIEQHTLDLYYDVESILTGHDVPWMTIAILYLKHATDGLCHPALSISSP